MKDYDALPMLMSESGIATAVAELLAEARHEPRPDPLVVAESLVTMLGRQSSHHRPFSPECAASIDDWVAEAWSTASVPLFDALAALAANTASPRTRALLEKALGHDDASIREIAAGALAEM